jgi:uncharacterized protein
MIGADEESAFFWDGLLAHRVLLQHCCDCGRHRFPPMPSCPWCGATETEVVESGGAGEIYSWITVHRPFDERWTSEVPYTVAVVALREGCRVFARVDAAQQPVMAGLAVRPSFVDHDGWTELRFVPAGGSS